MPIETNEKFISLKFDLSWKEALRNEIIRKYFIADVLNIPVEKIRSVRLMNTFLWRQHHWQKQGILDVQVELNDNTKINIELQIASCAYWDRRCLFYLTKMYTEDLRSGEDYEKLKKCISISILDFDFTKRKEYHTVYRLRDKDGKEFSEVLEVHIIELCKPLAGEDRINDWIRLFNATSKEECKMIQTKNPGILEAIKELEMMNLSKRLRLRYEAHLKAIRDRNARDAYVRELGQEEGRILERCNFIQKKRAKGLSDKEIADMLETTPESIKETMRQNPHH